ncbi:DUF899 family protein [Paraferrimonas sedimenticola]|uniref:DUF899 domain-containing protein n=1 Tax=Paraferrimonas sedimenticola TaxID=375674 RepID=A0AA37RV06_9GAMM|nr:DUF899 family protein [Paraferrimonas sedimenticola]GLP95871.1 hypothetical protein GCM10007895_11770 [Paraferrimonas sedimenticola]
MSIEQIAELEQEIFNKVTELNQLRKAVEGEPVADYEFETLEGKVMLSELFGNQDKLLMIHNMGQGCRYCTLWGDGINGLLAHLESALSVVLVSKNDPQTMRTFAASRGWKFRLASHGGGAYMKEQVAQHGYDNMPGAVVYERKGDKIVRTNVCAFGPGDLYCAAWPLLGLAGIGEAEWTPQFNYWLKPKQLEDGGENVLE